MDTAHKGSFSMAEFHLGADPEQISLLGLQMNQKPMIPIERTTLIQQKAHRAVVVGDHDVDRSVIVDITKCSAAAHLSQSKNGPAAGVTSAELLSIAFVVKQQIGLPKRIRSTSQRLDAVHCAIRNEQV